MITNSKGFSLVELMVVLAVAGIGLSIIVPNFSANIKHSRLTSSVNELLSAVHVARSEASKRGVPVVICRTSDNSASTPTCGTGQSWRDGWIVYADDNGNGAFDNNEDVIQRGNTQPDSIFVKSHADIANTITYLPNGFADLPLGNGNQRLILYCDGQGSDNYTRALVITNTGRPQVYSANSKNDSDYFTFPSCTSGGP